LKGNDQGYGYLRNKYIYIYIDFWLFIVQLEKFESLRGLLSSWDPKIKIYNFHQIFVQKKYNIFVCLAFYYTGVSTGGAKLWNVTLEIVKELSIRGFVVKGIVNDMGPSNQSLWKAAGIESKR